MNCVLGCFWVRANTMHNVTWEWCYDVSQLNVSSVFKLEIIVKSLSLNKSVKMFQTSKYYIVRWPFDRICDTFHRKTIEISIIFEQICRNWQSTVKSNWHVIFNWVCPFNFDNLINESVIFVHFLEKNLPFSLCERGFIVIQENIICYLASKERFICSLFFSNCIIYLL